MQFKNYLIPAVMALTAATTVTAGSLPKGLSNCDARAHLLSLNLNTCLDIYDEYGHVKDCKTACGCFKNAHTGGLLDLFAKLLVEDALAACVCVGIT